MGPGQQQQIQVAAAAKQAAQQYNVGEYGKIPKPAQPKAMQTMCTGHNTAAVPNSAGSGQLLGLKRQNWAVPAPATLDMSQTAWRSRFRAAQCICHT